MRTLDDPRKCILVVDDDLDILSIVSMLLEHEGYVVRTATNGQEALDAVAGEMPSLVLLDLKMPVMNGTAFARELRQRYDEPAPIVVMSAIDAPGRRAEEIGAEGWLAKPFDATALVDIVRRYVS